MTASNHSESVAAILLENKYYSGTTQYNCLFLDRSLKTFSILIFLFVIVTARGVTWFTIGKRGVVTQILELER